MKTRNLTINAAMMDAVEFEELASYGTDIKVQTAMSDGQILRILFEGFEDRLKAQGVKVKDTINFSG